MTGDTSLRQKIKDLHDESAIEFAAGELTRSLDLSRKALDLADSNGFGEDAAHNRWHVGTTLVHLEKLREGMAALAPLLQLNSALEDRGGQPKATAFSKTVRVISYESGPFEVLLSAYIVFVGAALQIPVSLSSIESVLQQVERLVTEPEYGYYRAMVLRTRADLASLRGMHKAALNVLQEAISIKSDERSLLSRVAECHLKMGDLASAQKYFERWDGAEEENSALDVCWSLDVRSRLASRGDDKHHALEIARELRTQVDYVVAPRLRRGALRTLFDALLAVDELARARSELLELATLRHTESKMNRYDIVLLCAHYHARAAKAHRVEGAERGPDAGISGKKDEGVVGHSSRKEFHKARAMYTMALRLATDIEDL